MENRYSDIVNLLNSIKDTEKQTTFYSILQHSLLGYVGGLNASPNTDTMLLNYMLSSKFSNKLKREDPSKKIIDAADIDWTGYEMSFNGVRYAPTTTTELLDLIFRLFQYLFSLHGSEDVVWNDNGNARNDITNKLNWGDNRYRKIVEINGVEYSFISDESSSTKYWENVRPKVEKYLGEGLGHNLPYDVEMYSKVKWTITIEDGYIFDESNVNFKITMGNTVITPVINGKVMTIEIEKVTDNIYISIPTKLINGR